MARWWLEGFEIGGVISGVSMDEVGVKVIGDIVFRMPAVAQSTRPRNSKGLRLRRITFLLRICSAPTSLTRASVGSPSSSTPAADAGAWRAFAESAKPHPSGAPGLSLKPRSYFASFKTVPSPGARRIWKVVRPGAERTDTTAVPSVYREVV